MQTWTLVYDIVLLLAASLVLGALFARLRQSAILGYLLAGTMLGPNGFNLIKSETSVQAIASLGTTLLLFTMGLEFSWQRLRSLGKVMILGGLLQVIATMLVAQGLCMLCGLGPVEAFVAGTMVTLSSTAVALRVFMDRAELDSTHARNTLAISLLQDLAVVPMALAINVLGKEGTFTEVATHVGKVTLMAAGLVLILYLLLNKIAVWGLGTPTMARNRELAILLAVVTGLGSAWAAVQADLSPALGAFVAGMFLGGSPFALQVRADIAPIRIVLLTLFFSAAGMLGDPHWMFANFPLLAGATALMLIGKTVIIWGILRWLGMTHASSVATGLCMAQLSEFAFVLGGLGLDYKILSESNFKLFASSTIVTLMTAPYIIPAAQRIGLWAERAVTRRKPATDAASTVEVPPQSPDVIVIGFGPAGQRVAQSLMGLDHAVLVIDQNVDSAGAARDMGCRFLPGDATQEEVLEHAHIAGAKVVVIALPVPTVVTEVLRQVRHLAPQASVIVRCRYHLFAHELEQAGAHAVIDEEQEVGRRLAAQVRRFLPDADARREDRKATQPLDLGSA